MERLRHALAILDGAQARAGGKPYFEALMAAFDSSKRAHRLYGPDNHLAPHRPAETQSIDKFNYGMPFAAPPSACRPQFVNNLYKAIWRIAVRIPRATLTRSPAAILQTIATCLSITRRPG